MVTSASSEPLYTCVPARAAAPCACERAPTEQAASGLTPRAAHAFVRAAAAPARLHAVLHRAGGVRRAVGHHACDADTQGPRARYAAVQRVARARVSAMRATREPAPWPGAAGMQRGQLRRKRALRRTAASARSTRSSKKGHGGAARAPPSPLAAISRYSCALNNGAGGALAPGGAACSAIAGAERQQRSVDQRWRAASSNARVSDARRDGAARTGGCRRAACAPLLESAGRESDAG